MAGWSQPGAEHTTRGHGGEEAGEGDDTGPGRDLVTLDEGDGDPVVGGALGEGRDEHEDPDEQGARLAPGRPPLRRSLGLVGRAVVGPGHEDPLADDDERCDEEHDGDDRRQTAEEGSHGYDATGRC